MNKSEIINAVAEELNTTKVEAKRFVESAMNQIVRALADGKEVSIPELGKFKITERAARTCRNPKTGEAVEVPASHAISFKPTSVLKTSVKEL